MEPRRAADKMIDILSDNRILPADWKWVLPMYIVQQRRPVVVNARNLANGILEGIEKYGIVLPDYYHATHENSLDSLLDEVWM